MKVEEILKKYKLKFEDLNPAERETLLGMMKSLENNQMSVEKIKDYLKVMRDSVELELVDEPEFIFHYIFRVFNRKHILLKARLKNYMLLEAFLGTPEKAKAALDRALAQVGQKKA